MHESPNQDSISKPPTLAIFGIQNKFGIVKKWWISGVFFLDAGCFDLLVSWRVDFLDPMGVFC